MYFLKNNHKLVIFFTYNRCQIVHVCQASVKVHNLPYMREIRINNPETGAIGTIKKENRKMAQQRRAEERRKKEFRRKLSKVLAIGIPILVVIILVVYSNKNSDNTGSSDNTTASSSSDTGSTTDNGTENSYSTDTSLTVEDGDTVNIY